MGVLEDLGLAIRAKRQEVWTRLYQRFLLDPGTVTAVRRPEVVTSVFPITNADEILAEWSYQNGSASVGIAYNDWQTAYTVPNGFRYYIDLMRFSRTSGDNTVSTIRIADDSRLASVYLWEGTATSNQLIRLEHQIGIEERDMLDLFFTGAGAAATVFALELWGRLEQTF